MQLVAAVGCGRLAMSRLLLAVAACLCFLGEVPVATARSVRGYAEREELAAAHASVETTADATTGETRRQSVIRQLLESPTPQARLSLALRTERRRAWANRGTSGSSGNWSALSGLLQFPVPDELREAASKMTGGKSMSPKAMDKARAQLNSLLQDERGRLDHKLVECRQNIQRLEVATEKAAAEARGMALHISQSRSVVSDSAANIPQDEEEFQTWEDSSKDGKAWCELWSSTLKQKEVARNKDAEALKRIHTGAEKQCSAGFLELTNSKIADAAEKQRYSGRLQLQVAAFRREIMKQRPSLRRKLQAALMRQSVLSLKATSQLQQASKASSDAQRVRRLRAGNKASGSAAFLEEKCKDPGCSVFGKQVCAAMLDAVQEVSGSIEDGQAQLQMEMEKHRQACAEDHKVDLDELQRVSFHKTELGVELADASSSVTGFLQQQKAKQVEAEHFAAEQETTSKQCQQEIHQLLYGSICGLQKLRDELIIVGGSLELPEDCEVSEWVEGACSATCGPGKATYSREVVVPAWKGSSCPPLQMVTDCGDAQCPTDCSVSAWSGWSKCTAECDGGVQQRTRNVLTRANWGGEACPQLLEARVCNNVDCIGDCDLADWSPWSTCDKACGGGSAKRYKEVVKEAAPGGNCPAEDAPERLQLQACNEQSCPEGKSICSDGKQDVVLLVDTSGSLASGTSNGNGFDLLRDLAAELAQRFANSGSKAAVASFAGEAVSVAGWTTDGQALSKDIESKLMWTKGPSLLAQGLTYVNTLFKSGARQESTWTALVLTDGRIGDPYKAELAADRLRKAGARLAFVPLAFEKQDDGRPTLIERLVSTPSKENIVVAVKNEAFAVNVTETADEVVRSMCSEISEVK